MAFQCADLPSMTLTTSDLAGLMDSMLEPRHATEQAPVQAAISPHLKWAIFPYFFVAFSSGSLAHTAMFRVLKGSNDSYLR